MSSEIRVTDPVTGGQKGVKLERYDLIPYDAADELASVYGFGTTKYEADNWLRGYRWRLSAGALLRHVSKWLQGERNDRESGRHHLAHAAWHCFTLMTFEMRGLGTDDRRGSSQPVATCKCKAVATLTWTSPWTGAAYHVCAECNKRLAASESSESSVGSAPDGWHPVRFARGDVCDDVACFSPEHFTNG